MIELAGIEVAFPNGVRALRGVDLRLQPGSVTVLLGRSGSGKSTLLRVCNGLQPPTRGQVLVDGAAVTSDWRRHRRAMAMVFQMHQLLPRNSALQNACIGSVGRRPWWTGVLPIPRHELAIAYEALARVGLADKARTRIEHLSGGERQRVGIARALVQRPRAMLADEPVASLDPATAQQVLDLLCAVCRQDGLTALISLHQLELARRVADRVVALAHGRIVFDGPPAALSTDAETGIYRTTSIAVPPRDGQSALEPVLIGA